MNYISTYAEIIDENECLRGLNLYTDCSWSSDFLKLKACEYEWCKYGFYPINGMVGEIVGLVSSNIYSEPILILRILEMFYVPITSSGVKVISTSEHSIKKMSQIKQIDAHKEYVTKTKDNSFKVVWRDGKCGFINNRGCHITEFEFEIGTAFSDGRALIQRSDLWGFIDYEGREVIKATYHTARSFNENRAVVESVGWKAINRFGETTSKSYHFMCDYSHGLSAVCLKSYTGFNWGFVDKDGIEIIPIIYDRVFDFNNGFAIIYKDRKYGIINESGTLIVPPIYDKISGITDVGPPKN